MWPFKKKVKEAIPEPISQKFKSVICIPGNWKDYDDFKTSLMINNNFEFLAIGYTMVNANAKIICSFEFYESDEKMAAAFGYAGRVTSISESTLDEIEQHRFVAYLIGETGSLKAAHELSLFASAVLKAGGLGVKIDTAGIAFDKEKWFSFFGDFEESNLYKMFVVDSITTQDGSVFTCGMQNLGYRDTIVSGEDFQDAVALIKLFGIYQIIDKPVILNNQTFRASVDEPQYIITDEPNQPYKGDETFGNPNGMWRLKRTGN